MKAFHRIPDRLLSIDLQSRGRVLQIAAVYIPHAGYSFDELHSLYDELHALFDYGMQKRFDLIVGGDFNTVVNLWPRWDLLNEMMAMFDLQIANSKEFLENDDQ